MGSQQSSMGSQQSNIQSITINNEKSSSSQESTVQENTELPAKKKKQPPEDLSGPKLVEYKCRKKKKAWTKCVGSWYGGRFLPGKALEEEQADCDELFERFRECYMRGMLKEREKRGLGPPKDDTMLAEFLDEEGIESKKQ